MTANGVSNGDLAAICGVSQQAARHWRLGVYRPSVPYAKLIAAHFGIGKHLLRPDIWDAPPPPPERRQAARTHAST